MKIYLVGGAVRDQLLKLPISERDWVVVGATVEAMLQQGFIQVGKDFPVFLHPKTHEEYALARTERKVGKGYTQFHCFADPKVTLEEDLSRRDLTINAMAQTLDGKLLDPYNGAEDLRKHILRHVSPAFAEDPVRILRVARFAAKLCDFVVHPTTYQLMRAMLLAGEVDALVPERVWQEMVRALGERCPYRFFEVLNDCQILEHLFPELAECFQEVVRVLKNAANHTNDVVIRFAALFCRGISEKKLQNFCKRLRVPRTYYELALLMIRHISAFCSAKQLTDDALLTLLEMLDVFRRPERFEQCLIVCAISQGESVMPHLEFLRAIYPKVKAISGAAIAQLYELENAAIKTVLHQTRLNEIKKLRAMM